MPRARLEAMRSALAHRGPDDSGIEVIENVALVHTRLAIVDLSPRGHQPMAHPNGDWLIAYNGEIYNHLALRAELHDATFVGDSDTETLVWALARWDVDAITRLSGQFAFAALDRRKGRLILCRDRFGIKPLYVATADDGVWFASEPEALFAAGVTAIAAADAWESVLTGAYLGGRPTLLEGITRIEPGAMATISVSDSSIEISRWNSPLDAIDPERSARLARLTRSQLTDELERTLRHAVHRSLLADATVGTFCSGGLDSSLITALAAEKKPGMVAFAAGFSGDGRLDEGLAAQRVANHLGIELEMIDVTPASWRAGFVQSTVHHGGPLANASAVTLAEMAASARECGVKVLMTGEGADELFGGYGNQHGPELERFLAPAQRAIRRLEPRLLTDPRRLLDPRLLAAKLGRLRAGSSDDQDGTGWPDRLMPATWGPNWEQTLAAYGHHVGARQAIEARLMNRMDHSLSWLLNRMDKNVMQASVEARVPFLEPEVVELAVNLPLEIRTGPWSKGILRDVARRVLPLSTAHRPKIYGLGYTAGSWIAESADPRFLTDGVMREALRVPRERLVSTLDSADDGLKLRLWSAEVWCRATFERQPVSAIEQSLWR